MKRTAIVPVLLATALQGSAAVVVAADSESALRRTLAQFDLDAGKGNLEGLMSLFAEDAVILGPGQAPVAGKPAIRAWWKGILDLVSSRLQAASGWITAILARRLRTQYTGFAAARSEITLLSVARTNR